MSTNPLQTSTPLSLTVTFNRETANIYLLSLCEESTPVEEQAARSCFTWSSWTASIFRISFIVVVVGVPPFVLCGTILSHD